VPEAVVFDVMGTLFDLSPLRDRLRAAGAPEGSLEAWFGRMLHGSASLTLVGEFRPFREVGKSSLESVLEQLGADVSKADEILQGLGELDPYPDVAVPFDHLRAAGVRIATLTNGAEDHTRRLLARAQLEDAVELVIAVDEVRAYKPHAAPTTTLQRGWGCRSIESHSSLRTAGTSSVRVRPASGPSGSIGSSGGGRFRSRSPSEQRR